eukprot:GHVQ01026825.1.p1 GENE.GHVQ01026825.1~~GHVQ01026825.1.p1  ORF type:complete len:546 (+),score=57.25 GHVQ01026825.1:70-1707(+)
MNLHSLYLCICMIVQCACVGCGCLPHGGRLGFDFSTTLLSSTVSQGWNNIETRTTADETKQTPNTGEVRQGAGTTDDETEEAEIAEDKLTRGQECTMRRQRYKLLQRCKGVRDFYPIDIRRRNWIFDKFRRVSEVYGFEEYESPLLEHRDLYQSTVRKSNGSSKVYNLVDQSGRNLVLRPEVTASLTRMLMSRKTQLCLPVRWFSVAQCWRYEAPKKGRRREHFQWNIDIWGVKGIEAEAEVLSMATDLLRKVGLSSKDIVIRVGHRALFRSLLDAHGIPASEIPNVLWAVDKAPKMEEDFLGEALANTSLTAVQVKGLENLLKGSCDYAYLKEQYTLTDDGAIRDIERLWELARVYGFDDWLELSMSTIRGPPYYSGLVFEAFDRQGEFRSLFGGGRYDGILDRDNLSKAGAVGLGLGDVVLSDLLAARNLPPSNMFLGDSLGHTVDIIVVSVGHKMHDPAVSVATRLRNEGWKTELTLQREPVGNVLGRAHSMGAAAVVIVGEEEWNSPTRSEPQVSIKILSSGFQRQCDVSELPVYMKTLFG